MDSPNRSSRPARRPRTRLDTRPAAPESAPTIHYGAAAARLLDRRSAAPNTSAARVCQETDECVTERDARLRTRLTFGRRPYCVRHVECGARLLVWQRKASRTGRWPWAASAGCSPG